MSASAKRSVRAQMLLNAIQSAQIAAAKNDYLQAVLNVQAAANMAGLKLPPKPYGTPDVVFGDVWKKWRAYYIQHYPKISEHVYNVLEKIAAGHIVVGEEAFDA